MAVAALTAPRADAATYVLDFSDETRGAAPAAIAAWREGRARAERLGPAHRRLRRRGRPAASASKRRSDCLGSRAG